VALNGLMLPGDHAADVADGGGQNFHLMGKREEKALRERKDGKKPNQNKERLNIFFAVKK